MNVLADFGALWKQVRSVTVVSQRFPKQLAYLRGPVAGDCRSYVPLLSSAEGRQRKGCGGRRAVERKQPGIRTALKKIVTSSSRGDPMGPLLWTCKSTRTIAAELRSVGFSITAPTVGKTLHLAGYSLQANRKTREGEDHPDRAQSEFINRCAIAYQRSGQPVALGDTKKKAILGNKKNAGQTWRPSGQPLEVDTHDFPDPTKGKAVKYGV
jgi:hypothetical protein